MLPEEEPWSNQQPYGGPQYQPQYQSLPPQQLLRRPPNLVTMNGSVNSQYVQPYWMNRGFNTRNVALCNTFTATPDTVR